MGLRRRTVLAGTGTLTVPLTGCLNGGSSRDLDLILRNYTSEQQPLQVEILRDDGSDRGEAQVMRREVEVPPPSKDDTAGVVRKPGIVPSGRYIVRILLKFGRGEWDHHHFVPSSAGAGEIDIGVYRDEDTGALYTRFL